jgi:hypothetical protein
MKKISTAATKQIRNSSQPKLTIGLDLRDRSRWYCLLDEGGEVVAGTETGYNSVGNEGSVRCAAGLLLTDGARNAGESVIGVASDQTNGPDNQDQNYGQHHCVLRDVLPLVVLPQAKVKLRHISSHGS